MNAIQLNKKFMQKRSFMNQNFIVLSNAHLSEKWHQACKGKEGDPV